MVPPPESTPPSQNRDHASIGRLLARDADGLRHLAEDHGPRTLAALRSTFGATLPASEIEDVFTSALMRLWEHPAAFDPGQGTLRAWLFVVARNLALTAVRRHQRERRNLSIEDFDQLVAGLANTRGEQDRLRRVADLHGCLTELPPLQRAVLQADLAAHGAARAPDLARRLDTTVQAIYAARHRGRAELARMMQRLGHYADRQVRRTAKKEPTPEFG